MTSQSEKQGAFDENDILVLQSIADNLAIALENNSSFEKTQKTLEEIRVLNKAFVQQAWGEALAVHGDLEAEFENSQLECGAGSTRSVQVPLY